MRIAGMVLGLALAMSVALAAQARPYEFLGCNFHEGKDMSDLDAWLVKFKTVLSRPRATRPSC